MQGRCRQACPSVQAELSDALVNKLRLCVARHFPNPEQNIRRMSGRQITEPSNLWTENTCTVFVDGLHDEVKSRLGKAERDRLAQQKQASCVLAPAACGGRHRRRAERLGRPERILSQSCLQSIHGCGQGVVVAI